MSTLTVKAYLNAAGDANLREVRRFPLPEEHCGSYAALLQKVHLVFEIPLDEKIELFWVDSDNDHIKFSSDDEQIAGLQACGQSGLFKIHVVSGNNLSSSRSTMWQNVLCDDCGKSLIGWRYKCTVCADFDLCSACMQKDTHEQHSFLLRRTPHESTMFPLSPPMGMHPAWPGGPPPPPYFGPPGGSRDQSPSPGGCGADTTESGGAGASESPRGGTGDGGPTGSSAESTSYQQQWAGPGWWRWKHNWKSHMKDWKKWQKQYTHGRGRCHYPRWAGAGRQWQGGWAHPPWHSHWGYHCYQQQQQQQQHQQQHQGQSQQLQGGAATTTATSSCGSSSTGTGAPDANILRQMGSNIQAWLQPYGINVSYKVEDKDGAGPSEGELHVDIDEPETGDMEADEDEGQSATRMADESAVRQTMQKMREMGFEDPDGQLRRLVELKRGNIDEVLEAIRVHGQQQRSTATQFTDKNK